MPSWQDYTLLHFDYYYFYSPQSQQYARPQDGNMVMPEHWILMMFTEVQFFQKMVTVLNISNFSNNTCFENYTLSTITAIPEVSRGVNNYE